MFDLFPIWNTCLYKHGSISISIQLQKLTLDRKYIMKLLSESNKHKILRSKGAPPTHKLKEIQSELVKDRS